MNKKTLIIGASLNPDRYSYRVLTKLIENKHKVYAIGKKPGKVMGVAIETEKILISELHTVTLYINAQTQEDYYDYIINLQPKRVIFNPGTENNDFVLQLKKNSIFVESACTLVLLSTGQY